MRFGFVLPYGDARAAAELAVLAEQAGWDGFFVWEPVWGFDAWVLLTAAAMRTERIRLGTMLTPLARIKPWKLASEAVTLDHLSGGRVIIAVGLGAPEAGWAPFNEPQDRKLRAELLDEGLDVLFGLWQGQPFSYQGRHYQLTPTDFLPPPPPLQRPRIPVWVVGALGREKSMRRALRCDGLLPMAFDPDGKPRQASPAELAGLPALVAEHRPAGGPFEIVVEGATPGEDPAAAAEVVRPWAEAGATWWIEALWSVMEDPEAVRRRVTHGPPRLAKKED